MNDLPFQGADPAHVTFQYLEDLSTAYWFSEVLFASIELNLFDIIEKNYPRTDELAEAAECKKNELKRLLTVLGSMKLIMQDDTKHWINSQAAGKFLLPDSESYMGDFFLYRKDMHVGWKTLTQKVSKKKFQGLPLLTMIIKDEIFIMSDPWMNW